MYGLTGPKGRGQSMGQLTLDAYQNITLNRKQQMKKQTLIFPYVFVFNRLVASVSVFLGLSSLILVKFGGLFYGIQPNYGFEIQIFKGL